MKQYVVLPLQSNYNYGERCRFLHGSQDAEGLLHLGELTDYLAIIYNNVMFRPQKLVNNDTQYYEKWC